jgi:hypothetical protein
MTATGKEALWAKYSTAAPRLLTPSERQIKRTRRDPGRDRCTPEVEIETFSGVSEPFWLIATMTIAPLAGFLYAVTDIPER